MTAASIAVFPAAAMAEEVVPPGNSAVNQYTETIPTPGGGRDTESKGGKQQRQSPEKALGTRNTQQLEKHGSDGRATADLAAETAPSTASPEPAEETEEQTSGEDSEETQASGGGNQGGGNDSRGQGKTAIGPAHAVSVDRASPAAANDPEGSSGVGEVLGEATGGSSGQLGLLLPLLIVVVAIWSVAYLLRQRRQVG